jgi:hypothetical protein
MKKNSSRSEIILPHKILLVFGLVTCLVILAEIGWAFFVFFHQAPPARNSFQTVTRPCLARSALDGTTVACSAEQVLPYAVIIENQHAARPLSGLARARLVYETIAESTITRFLAFFDPADEVLKIGPVRSARTYFVSWALEFNGIFGHVGGNDDALLELQTAPLLNLDEFAHGQYFWRDSKRYAPHNAYTSSVKIAAAAWNKSWPTEGTYDSWIFKDEAELPERGMTGEIKINFLAAIDSVRWQYDRATNVYVRYQAGERQIDADGTPVTAKNVAVMKVESVVIDKVNLYRRTTTIGTGAAIVFRDGQVIKGVWRRPMRMDRTRFYDENNQEISFNAGATWIEAIPSDFPEVSFE